MNKTVRDFMNPELVYLSEGQREEFALGPILALGITAVPVLDEDHRPVGIVSLRDLVDDHRGGARTTEPVETIAIDCTIDAAAVALTDADVHHLVVVDGDGRAAGMLSAVDVVRAFLGIAPKHPRSIGAMDRGAHQLGGRA
jgi:CBS domain-containing protein